jgi:hypothetical protein
LTRRSFQSSSAALLVAVLAQPVTAQQPTLATVLGRAAAYVDDFQREFSGIVAEERYRQDWKQLPKGYPLVAEQRQRDLVSDVLLVKLGGSDWMQFRDVFDVDGSPVRDRSERLMKLFVDESTESPESRSAQIAKILRESARHNIGDISRTVNMPVLALTFLSEKNQRRFKFFRAKESAPLLRGDSTFRTPAGAWVVRFEENEKNTVLRTGQNKPLPSHGRFWLDPVTGRVLLSELIAEDRRIRATIDVDFQSEPLRGLGVPIAMRELYEGRATGSRIEGAATYGRFRQFQIKTDEKFTVKK